MVLEGDISDQTFFDGLIFRVGAHRHSLSFLCLELPFSLHIYCLKGYAPPVNCCDCDL